MCVVDTQQSFCVFLKLFINTLHHSNALDNIDSLYTRHILCRCPPPCCMLRPCALLAHSSRLYFKSEMVEPKQHNSLHRSMIDGSNHHTCTAALPQKTALSVVKELAAVLVALQLLLEALCIYRYMLCCCCCSVALPPSTQVQVTTTQLLRRQFIEHNNQSRTRLGRRVLAIKPQDTATHWALLTGLFTLQGMVAGCV